MNFKTITKQALAAALLFGLISPDTQGQTEIQKGKARLLETGMQASSKTGRILTPVQATRHKIQRAGKEERINKAPGDTLFFQDFSGTTWPANMPRVNRDGLTPNSSAFGTNAWVIRENIGSPPNIPVIPGRYAVSTSWYVPAGQADDWMITPEITLTDNNILIWKSMAFEAQYADGYEVRMCTSCPATFNNGNVLTSFSNVLFSVDQDQAVAFEEHQVDLAAYSGQTVRFAYRNNSSDQNMLLIDDILVARQPTLDISAGIIFSPSNSIYNCSRTSFPAVVSISNKGVNTAYNIGIKLRSLGAINDSSSVIIDSLERGKSDTIVMPTGLNLSTIGQYNLVLETTLNGDEISGNNISLGTYDHKGPVDAPFSTNFDELSADSTLPEEWFSTSRFIPFNETAGFNGTTSIELPVYNNLGSAGSSPECRLITRKFKNIANGSYFSFKYKLTVLDGTEYSMTEGDTVYARIWKNCTLIGSAATITSGNHDPSTSYRKIFTALTPFGITPTDEVTFEFYIKAASSTQVYLCEIDDFYIGEAPAANDVAMVDLEKLPFSQVKKYQFATPLKIKGSVFNEGLTDLTPVRIVADVVSAGLQDTARVSQLPSGVARSFTTNPGLSFTNVGDFTVNVSASSPGITDPNPADNNLNFAINVNDSTMAKDFGDPLDIAYLQYGAGSTGKRIIANSIKTVLRDTLTSVSVYVGPLAENCVAKAFFANKNTQGNWVEDSSSIAVPITTDMADSWVPLRWWKLTPAVNQKGKPVALNSENLYGVKIRSGNLRVGFNFENATDDGSFIWLGTSFLGTQDVTLGSLQGPFSVFIRANFGRMSTIISGMSQVEQSLYHAEIAPNPASGNTQLLFNTKEGGEVNIEVYSLSGQLVASATDYSFTGTNRLSIPVKGLQKGMYLVKIQSKGFASTKKLILE